MVEKEKKPENWQKLVDVRKALTDLWEEALVKGFRGRTWGQRNSENPFRATNITMAIGDEAVVVNQDLEGNLQIHGFSRDANTSLEKRVHERLQEEGLIESSPHEPNLV